MALWTHRVYNRMRDEVMAEDLREYRSRYSEVVFFAGDDHIDPAKKSLSNEFEVVEKEKSRP